MLAAVALAACGSDSKDSGKSKADIQKEASAICSDVKKELGAVKTPSNINDPAQALAYFDEAVPISQKAVDKLKALEPSGDYKTDYDAYVSAQSEQIDALAKVREKAKAKDPSGLKDLQNIDDTKTSDAAKKAGLKACV
jgi:ABC-type enterochelin transport system substrate-binding protein